MTIHRLSAEQVSKCYKGWENLEYYPEQEYFLKELFTDTYPENVDRDEVLIKVSSLDSLYSTNIAKHVYPIALAEHIVGLKIDQYTKSIAGSNLLSLGKISNLKRCPLPSFMLSTGWNCKKLYGWRLFSSKPYQDNLFRNNLA